jgi:hypothetical protein
MNRKAVAVVLSISLTLLVFAQAATAERSVLRNPCWSKGGIGIVGDSVYVELRKPYNCLLVDRHEWKGKPLTENQVVWTDGHKILSDKDKFNCDELIVIIFCKKEVRFVNYKTGSVGYYSRTKAFPIEDLGPKFKLNG